jgi:hypothetical protein
MQDSLQTTAIVIELRNEMPAKVSELLSHVSPVHQARVLRTRNIH